MPGPARIRPLPPGPLSVRRREGHVQSVYGALLSARPPRADSAGNAFRGAADALPPSRPGNTTLVRRVPRAQWIGVGQEIGGAQDRDRNLPPCAASRFSAQLHYRNVRRPFRAVVCGTSGNCSGDRRNSRYVKSGEPHERRFVQEMTARKGRLTKVSLQPWGSLFRKHAFRHQPHSFPVEQPHAASIQFGDQAALDQPPDRPRKCFARQVQVIGHVPLEGGQFE